MTQALPCPFCGYIPTLFGHDIIQGKKTETVIHPHIEGVYCPLNLLVFPIDAWNYRIDDTIIDGIDHYGNID
jgi:hypothetical protein